MRILIFGDGSWAANSLLQLARTGHEVAAVVIRRNPSDSSLQQAACSLNIPVLQPSKASSAEFVTTISKLSADLGLSISYNQILRRPILDSTRFGFVNIHAGMLPFYRGRNVINWAIINGESEIGLTAHFVDEGIDTGDIVLQRTLPIGWTDSYGDVLSRIVDCFPAFVSEAVSGVETGDLVQREQRHLAGTYFSGREDGDEWLDWSDTSFNLYNKVRAITRPGPGARTLFRDRIVVVWNAIYDREWPKYIGSPGQIVGRNDVGVVVKTGDSTLVLSEVQIDGDVCERPSWPIGTRLGINLMDIVRSLQSRIQALEYQISIGKKHGASGSR